MASPLVRLHWCRRNYGRPALFPRDNDNDPEVVDAVYDLLAGKAGSVVLGGGAAQEYTLKRAEVGA